MERVAIERGKYPVIRSLSLVTVPETEPLARAAIWAANGSGRLVEAGLTERMFRSPEERITRRYLLSPHV